MLALSKKSSASVANVLAPIGEVLAPIGEVLAPIAAALIPIAAALAPIAAALAPIADIFSYTEVDFKATMSSFYHVLIKLKKKALSFFL